jgi:methyl-accepting chemotaxis protein
MSTVAASGTSTSLKTANAAAEAIAMARRGLNGREPTMGFAFVSPQHDLGTALEVAEKASGAVPFIGCTTAGEITERGLTHGGLSVLLLATDSMSSEAVMVNGLKQQPESAAQRGCQPYAAMAKEGKARGRVYSSSVLLIDGLSGVGTKVVETMRTNTKSFNQIVGGAAGDEGAFKATLVGSRGRVASDAAAAMHVFGPNPWGVGIGHGLRPKTSRMKVTRAEGNVVHELDGKPAFEAYKTYARERGVELQPETAGRFMIGNELGVYAFDELQTARAPLSVGKDGSLTCAAEVERGSFVCILDGETDSMVAAAKRAAEQARQNLKGQAPAALLLFDCVCRGMILGDRFQLEIDAVKSVFPGVPIAGFLTYGEIARFVQQLQGWHNTTAVVAAIPAS